MAFNDPFFDSMNFVFDSNEVTFDDLGLGLFGINAGRPPIIPGWVAPYGVKR